MANNYFNPLGAVELFDFGKPRILTVKARTTISGGWWVLGSTADNVVSSGANSYAASDLEGYPVATLVGSEVLGVALQTIPSGTYGPVAMDGAFIFPVGSATRIGPIYSGWAVCAGSAGTVVPLGSNTLLTPLGGAVGVGADSMKVGKSLSTASNDGTGFVIVAVNI